MGLMGRIPQSPQDLKMKRNRRAKRPDIRHVLAVLAGVACFAIVYLYTGDSDLLFAISSGLAVGALSYVTTNLAIVLRNRAG